MAYESFAEFYDLFMQDADYAARTKYLLSLFESYDQRPNLLLDLACGTGSFSRAFHAFAVDTVGVDPSPEMLSIAHEKDPEGLYLMQSAEELDLYGTVDGAICCMDSVNHIVDYESLKTAFLKVSLFLEPQRLFIFDVNTVYKHEKILGNNAFVLENDGVFCSWQNATEGHFTDIYLDFFKELPSGDYQRFSDLFTERAYTKEELTEALKAAGFKVEAVLGDLTDQPPEENCDRVYFVARKIR